jgi:uncharacterized protein (DUF433 family)
MKLDRITRNPNQMNGQPCIRDLRLTVRRLLELLATYPDRQELFQEFPELEEEDIQQALVVGSNKRLRSLGLDTGVFTVPDDFDAPLPEDILDAFEGK